MIKSFRIEPENQKVTVEMADQVSFVKGKSIFKISTAKIERELEKKFLSARKVHVKRIFPDRIRVDYEFRIPVAVLQRTENLVPEHSDSASLNFVDGEGVVFKWENSETLPGNYPVMSVSSGASVSSAISFLKCWNNEDSVTLSSSTIQKITVDGWNEIAFILDDFLTGQSGVRIVWGEFESGTFSEKLQRFEEVWSDLKNKNMKVQYVNLRDAAAKNSVALGDREIVGRIVVRPINQELSIMPSKRKES